MRKLNKYGLDQAKDLIKTKYQTFDSLLEFAAELLLKVDDAEKVERELLDSSHFAGIVSKSINEKVRNITPANMMLKIQASLGNQFAVNALQSIYPNMEKGRKFKPTRAKGSMSIQNKFIHKLTKDNPHLSAKELERLADKSTSKMDIKSSTFANQVSKTRRQRE